MILDMNFVWMNGNNVYIPHSQNESTAALDPVFFENSMSQAETIQPRMVSTIVVPIHDIMD